jgi:cellulose synthase (UDP-forming)
VRRAALDDIVFTSEERGYPVLSYIRDRTLNEDTDTTVDLIRKNWTVYNYPDRLAYSATPPDFGALLIQRRRWATGGLIILPNLFPYILDKPSFRRLLEGLIRAQYILSAPLGSIGAVMLMLYPFNRGTMWSVWPWPAFLAYLVTFGRDLMHNGNRGADLFRVISLNAMLLPINLSGAINSLRQLWTGRKIPFQRTPKVSGRTAATPVHIAAQFGLFVVVSVQAPLWLAAGEWLACLFFLSFAAAFGYAMHVFIGWQAAVEDLFGGLERRPRLLLKSLWAKSLVHRSR